MEIYSFAIERGGILTALDAESSGIPRARLSEAAAKGKLRRVARGVYCLPEAWEDEYAIANLRFSKGVLSHGTALFLHDLTDKTPERVTMTFPRSYNASSAREEGLSVKTCAVDVHGLGLTEVTTPAGNAVRCYNIERTLCDMMRGTSVVDVQVVNPAMKRYVQSGIKDISTLLDYAKKLGVEKKMRGYVEVLL